MRVELGGGRYPRGEGWVNVDLQSGPGIDHVCDFATLHPEGPGRLPFQDDTVTHVYSSHCLEHVSPMKGFLWETARICKVGATVEIRVPHYLSAMAMCHGHRQVISPEQVDHWCRHFIDFWWQGSPKRWHHVHTEQIPGALIEEARHLFPAFTDEQLMRFVPGCAHELRYWFEVVVNR